VGNDSRCGGSSELMCNKLEQEGADCRWRGAFSVTGTIETSISDAQDFIDDPLAKDAVKKAIANVTNVPAEYVDVDLFEGANRSRRLTLQQVTMADSLLVTYAIAVGGDAPASVAVTGEDVSMKMTSSNSATISDAIASKVDESFGAGVFAVSVQTVSTPDVAVAPSELSTSSTSIADTSGAPTSETTSSAQSTTAGVTATTSVSSRTFLQVDLDSGAHGCIAFGLQFTMACIVIALLE